MPTRLWTGSGCGQQEVPLSHGFARMTMGLGQRAESLSEEIRDRVHTETGVRPAGPVRLLTHLRYFGFCFNPVSFYYCFEADGEALSFIVAEVGNTPWGERHAYVLDARDKQAKELTFEFDKQFHVSPFMPMTQRYRWRFSSPDEALQVAMTNLEDGAPIFHAGMELHRRPMSSRWMARALLRFPVMTLTVVTAIYWQALRLWLKRTPFFAHPRHNRPQELSS